MNEVSFQLSRCSLVPQQIGVIHVPDMRFTIFKTATMDCYNIYFLSNISLEVSCNNTGLFGVNVTLMSALGKFDMQVELNVTVKCLH